jgi:hypothetical protein
MPSAFGQTPRTAVSLPHFLALPARLNNSSLAAIVPRPSTHPITIYELPYPTTRLKVRSLWHERHASQNWLHEAIWRASSHLRADAAP